MATSSNKLSNRLGLHTKIYKFDQTDIVGGVFTPDPANLLLDINFANITDIDVSGATVWSTGGQNHAKQVPFDDPLEGSFKLTTQCVPLQLKKLVAGTLTLSDTATYTGTALFKNDSDGTSSPSFYTITSETLWKDADGNIVNETITAFKTRPQKKLTGSYSGTGDPQSLEVIFDLTEDANGNVFATKLADATTTG